MEIRRDPITKEETELKLKAAPLEESAAEPTPVEAKQLSPAQDIKNESSESSDPEKGKANKRSGPTIQTAAKLESAAFHLRVLASLIDLAIVLPVTALLAFPALLIIPALHVDPGIFGHSYQLRAVFSLGISFIFPWLYFAMLECSPLHSTFGMRALGLRVLDSRSNSCGFWKSTCNFGWHLAYFMVLLQMSARLGFSFLLVALLIPPLLSYGSLLFKHNALIDTISDRRVVKDDKLVYSSSAEKTTRFHWIATKKAAIVAAFAFAACFAVDVSEANSLVHTWNVGSSASSLEAKGQYKEAEQLMSTLSRKDKAIASSISELLFRTTKDELQKQHWFDLAFMYHKSFDLLNSCVRDLLASSHPAVSASKIVTGVMNHPGDLSINNRNRLKALRADAYEHEQKYAEAFQDLQSYVNYKYTGAEFSPYSRALSAYDTADLDQAYTDYYKLAELADSHGTPSETLDACDTFLRLSMYKPEFYLLKAKALKQLGRTAESAEYEKIGKAMQNSASYISAFGTLNKPKSNSRDDRYEVSLLKKALEENAPTMQVYLALSEYCGNPAERLKYLTLAERANREMLFSISSPSLFYLQRAVIEQYNGEDAIKSHGPNTKVSEKSKEKARDFFARAAEDFLRAADSYDIDMLSALHVEKAPTIGSAAIKLKTGASSCSATSILDLDQVKAQLLHRAQKCYAEINDTKNADKVAKSLQELAGTETDQSFVAERKK